MTDSSADPALKPARLRARSIAFYLPQFHSIPENDEWWGAGFTEWTNVRKAKPLYPGHDQPKKPGVLGYYDLRDPSVAVAQADLAKAAGIEGFCYWHYWFGDGRRLLEMPFDRMLATKEPDFPFCLCWANQTWSGIWHGAPNRVLMEQRYPGTEDLRAHVALLAKAFADERYMRVDDKPIFVIYSPSSLPNVDAFVQEFRELVASHGFPGVHLIAMANDPTNPAWAPFDRVSAFGPGEYLDSRLLGSAARLLRRAAASKWLGAVGGALRKRLRAPVNHQYGDVVDAAFENLPSEDRYIPCVLTGWDNTPRSGRRGVVFEGMTPTLFRKYVRKALKRVEAQPEQRRIVFFKAWNEWAEGNVLEPTADEGTAYLDVVRDEMMIERE